MRILLCLLLVLMIGCQTVVEPTIASTERPTATMTPQVGIEFATFAPPTAAVVQITPSPLPSATPTATPTPIVYEIQGGDTLWSIALLNRTLPQTIEALNPNLRPESLQIGQALVLPPQPTALAADVVGTPIPVSIVVRSLIFYLTPVGSGWVMGEVENVGMFSAENIRLQVTLLDENEQSLGDLFTWAAVPLLPPNASAPFAAHVPNIGIEPANLSAAVIEGKTVTDLGLRYLDLEPLDVQLAESGTQLTVSATISNSGVLTPSEMSLVTTLYDAAGNVNGMGVEQVNALLVAGETRSFSVDMIPLSPNTRRVELFVYGRLPTSEGDE